MSDKEAQSEAPSVDEVRQILKELQTNWIYESPSPDVETTVNRLLDQAVAKINRLIVEATENKVREFERIIDEESHLYANNSHVGRVRASIKRRLE